jgi:hypothetical protein
MDQRREATLIFLHDRRRRDEEEIRGPEAAGPGVQVTETSLASTSKVSAAIR